MAPAVAEPAELLTDAELGRKLGVSKQWVQKACRSDELPFVKVGRYYRFYWPDVLDRLRG